MQALIKIDGKQKTEDWTNKPYVNYCLDRCSGRVQELVLIIANSDEKHLDKTLEPRGLAPTLWASNLGCWRWQGTATNTTYFNGLKLRTTASVTWDRVAGTDLDQRDDLPDGARYLVDMDYRPIAGAETFQESGIDPLAGLAYQVCTVGGGGTHRLTAADGQMELYNYAVAGLARHGYDGNGGGIASYGTTASCRGPGGVVTTPPPGKARSTPWFGLVDYPLNNATVSPNSAIAGLDVGNGGGVIESTLSTTTWTFRPLRE